MENDIQSNFESRSLNELLNDWQEGKLNEEQKEYVVSKVPIMGYIHVKQDDAENKDD